MADKGRRGEEKKGEEGRRGNKWSEVEEQAENVKERTKEEEDAGRGVRKGNQELIWGTENTS
ncbi:hypothetical protein SLEP1_g51291 [Rubroshorea leprosula]|uniref:Uncharacterized protein n=1 Tax=Rubroshorea leprosula TaxID=152421 RepID=A0AAV5M4U5_9ROSI|nr:hypothetical protein SLEP1_g51291 [Rubroshorea leprosula]